MYGLNIGQPVERTCDVAPQTMIDRLKRREGELKAHLARVEKAIKTLEENPEIANVLEALNGGIY